MPLLRRMTAAESSGSIQAESGDRRVWLRLVASADYLTISSPAM